VQYPFQLRISSLTSCHEGLLFRAPADSICTVGLFPLQRFAYCIWACVSSTFVFDNGRNCGRILFREEYDSLGDSTTPRVGKQGPHRKMKPSHTVKRIVLLAGGFAVLAFVFSALSPTDDDVQLDCLGGLASTKVLGQTSASYAANSATAIRFSHAIAPLEAAITSPRPTSRTLSLQPARRPQPKNYTAAIVGRAPPSLG